MIQQLISTSAPKCLNGNAGFGIVAQTHGMAPNVANAVNALSAYSHHFPAGSPQNPAAFLHTLRRTGGMLRHIVSRVADCGNDYTGRTNRLAHHWLVEENDVWTLPCGPAALAAQAIFRTEWNEASRELPPKDLENIPVSVQKCTEWERLTGDAGWAGIVAERAEKGDPISIIFKIGMNPLSLLAEVFALLPPAVRWQTSFSTFFIKSQEPAGASREDKIQIKCFLEGTEEANFARQSPNTLVIDLRQKLPTGQQLFAAGACSAPGKYVEAARTGQVQTVSPGLAQAPQVRAKSPSEHDAPFATPIPSAPEQDVFAVDDLSMNVPKLMSRGLNVADKAKLKRRKQQSPWLMLSACAVVMLLGLGILAWLFVSAKSAKEIDDAKMAEQQKQEAAVKEQSAKEAEGKENAAKEAEEKKQAEEKAAKEAEEKKQAEEKAAKEAEEKKQAEEKAAKEAEEKKQAEDKAKKDKENASDKLPSIWTGLSVKANAPMLLDKSNALWQYKDEITLKYEPFVNLEATKDGDTGKKDSPVSVNYDNDKHKIIFAFKNTNLDRKDGDSGTGLNPDGTSKQSENRNPTPNEEGEINGDIIATVELTEKGLIFKATFRELIIANNKYNTEKWRYLANRILLGKLTVSGKEPGNRKEISLISPMEYKIAERDVSILKGEPFLFWKENNQSAEWVIESGDNCHLLLLFPEGIQSQGSFSPTPKKISDKSDGTKGFSQEVQVKVAENNEKGWFIIEKEYEKGNETKKFTAAFVLEKNEEIQKTIDRLTEEKKSLEKKKNQAGDAEREKKRIRDAAEKNARTTTDVQLSTWQQQLQQNPNNRQLDVTVQNVLKNRAEFKTAGENYIVAQKAHSKAKIAYKNKTDELEAEKEKLITPDIPNVPFSIYLLKSGTAKGEALKQENQLLLLEVKEK